MRSEGIKTMGALGEGSMKNQLRLADKFKVPYTVIMGITEVREGTAIIRNMQKGTQEAVPLDKVVPNLKKKLGESKLDKYTTGELLYS